MDFENGSAKTGGAGGGTSLLRVVKKLPPSTHPCVCVGGRTFAVELSPKVQLTGADGRSPREATRDACMARILRRQHRPGLKATLMLVRSSARCKRQFSPSTAADRLRRSRTLLGDCGTITEKGNGRNASAAPRSCSGCCCTTCSATAAGDPKRETATVTRRGAPTT